MSRIGKGGAGSPFSYRIAPLPHSSDQPASPTAPTDEAVDDAARTQQQLDSAAVFEEMAALMAAPSRLDRGDPGCMPLPILCEDEEA